MHKREKQWIFKNSGLRSGAACLLFVVSLLPLTAQAEFLGMLAGREATLARSADLSVELGFSAGELGDIDQQNIAARVNYRLSPRLLFIGSAGVGEYGNTDGIPLGVGLMYHLDRQRISKALEISTRASYHFADYSVGDLDGELSTLVLDVLVSGRNPIMDNGLAWYSNLGYNRITKDYGDKDVADEVGFGAGLVLPTGLGDAYLGMEYTDGFSFGLGIRYFVQ